MKKANEQQSDDDMRPEYDFTTGVRGKYYRRYREGTNLVLIDDSATVNLALRQFQAEHGEQPRSTRKDR